MTPVEQNSKQKKGKNQPVKPLPKVIKVAECLNVQGEAENFKPITGKTNLLNAFCLVG